MDCRCSGGADVHFVSTNLTAIDPPQIAPYSYQPQECYWWLGDSGELNIAMRYVKTNPLLGKLGRLEFAVSLVLPGLPAGSGRDYQVRQRDVRTVLAAAIETHRFSAYGGVVKVVTADQNRLSGTFRLGMSHQPGMSLLMIVPRTSGPYLFWGDFEAVRDPIRGQAIREFCEADGWGRLSPAGAPVSPVHSADSQPASPTPVAEPTN